MTDHRPGGQPRPFGSEELEGVAGIRPDELAAESRLARELEGVAARGTARPSPDFADRVMAAVAKEPVAAPARAAGVAIRHGAVGAFLASLRDAWRVTISPSFPMAMRAQAMAMVLLVAGLAAGSGVVTAGALGLLDARPNPSPSVEAPSPSFESPELSSDPADASESLEPSESPEPSTSIEVESEEPSDSAEPAETAEPTDTPDDHGGSSGGGGSSSGSGGASRTPSPTATPEATPSPTETDESGPGGGEDSATPSPSGTSGGEHGPTPSPSSD